jgi:hypothetical protein
MRFPRNPPDHGLVPLPLRYPSQIYEITLGISVFVGLLIADRLMGKEKRPRGAMIAWFFALYFTGRLFTEFYKEIEALPSDSAVSMGQYLSILPALLGWYGVYWTMKRKEPSGWGEALPVQDEGDDDDDDDDEDDEEPAPARARKTKAAAVEDDEGDEGDEGDDDDDEEPASTKKSAAVDPDVEAEFEAGKLKKTRKEPSE